MKKWSVLVFSLILWGLEGVSFAKDPGLGFGVMLGNPSGPTVKYWLSGDTAWDLAIGFEEEASVQGGFLWHAWDVFSQPKPGRLGGYVGVGAKLQEKKKNNLLGIRMVGGMAYFTPRYPFEFFLELASVFEIAPHIHTDIDAGFGLRYYFISP